MFHRIRHTTIVLAFFLLRGVTLQAQVPPQQNPPVPVLVVNGESQISVAPDQATVRLGILKQQPTADAAQSQANMVAQEILNAITKTGVSASQIRTSRLTLNPVHAQRRDSFEPPRIVAYSAQNVVTVTVQDLAKVGPVIDAGLKAGANELLGVNFELKNDLAARQQALKQAVTEARKKAETMAEAMDIKLGGALEVVEGGASVVPQPFPYAGAEAFAARAAADIAPTPVSPGELEVHANVMVRYRIEGK
jgi:uncharacterized protein YggE